MGSIDRSGWILGLASALWVALASPGHAVPVIEAGLLSNPPPAVRWGVQILDDEPAQRLSYATESLGGALFRRVRSGSLVYFLRVASGKLHKRARHYVDHRDVYSTPEEKLDESQKNPNNPATLLSTESPTQVQRSTVRWVDINEAAAQLFMSQIPMQPLTLEINSTAIDAVTFSGNPNYVLVQLEGQGVTALPIVLDPLFGWGSDGGEVRSGKAEKKKEVFGWKKIRKVLRWVFLALAVLMLILSMGSGFIAAFIVSLIFVVLFLVTYLDFDFLFQR